MSAYIVSRVSISDPTKMAEYMKLAQTTVARYRGKYLVRTQDIQVLEGAADYERVVIVEFESKERALAWYESSEYKPLRDMRWESASAHIICVEGDRLPTI